MPRKASAEPTWTIVPRLRADHPLERGARAPDHAVVRDLGRAPVLVRLDVEELGVDRRHRVVDPDVDRPELALRRLRCRLDLVGVGDVGGEDESLAAAFLDLGGDAVQARLAAGQKRDPRAVVGESPRGRAADSARGTRDDDDVAHLSRSSDAPRKPNLVRTLPTGRAPPPCRRRAARAPGRPAGPRTAPTAPRPARRCSAPASSWWIVSATSRTVAGGSSATGSPPSRRWTRTRPVIAHSSSRSRSRLASSRTDTGRTRSSGCSGGGASSHFVAARSAGSSIPAAATSARIVSSSSSGRSQAWHQRIASALRSTPSSARPPPRSSAAPSIRPGISTSWTSTPPSRVVAATGRVVVNA